MRLIAACFEIWVGVYVVNLMYPEKEVLSELKYWLVKIIPVLTAVVMGIFLYRNRMNHYISSEGLLVYTMVVSLIMALVKRVVEQYDGMMT